MKTVPAIVRDGVGGVVGTDATELRVDEAGEVVDARLVVEATATGATEEDGGMISAREVEGRTVGWIADELGGRGVEEGTGAREVAATGVSGV